MLSLYWLLSIGIRSLPACGSRDRLQESGPGVCVAVELHALTALERREFVGVKLDSETAGFGSYSSANQETVVRWNARFWVGQFRSLDR
jgi:hypothetical protein